jgi:hypothetical protein
VKALPLIVAAILASMAWTAAGGRERAPAMLPPEMPSRLFFAHYLEGFGEPALWPPGAARRYRTRMRLTIRGIRYAKIAIRIDQGATGRLSGHLSLVDRHDHEDPDGRSERDFPVSRAQFAQLQRAVAAAPLWRHHPEFWQFTDDSNICVDGMELIFERMDAEGYRFANANAQCTAPPDLLRVAETFIDISGERSVRHWLQ